jgi:arylsulfatase
MGDWLYIWNAWPDRHNVSVESSGFDMPAAKELWEAAAAGKLNENQKLMTSANQPPEMLFHVGKDPNQFNNLAGNPEYEPVLNRMREQLVQWKKETGDSLQKKPTPDRQTIHYFGKKQEFIRGEMPGEDLQATRINDPGPVKSPLTH